MAQKVTVDFTLKAKRDINSVYSHYVKTTDPQNASVRMTELVAELEKVAVNTFVGKPSTKVVGFREVLVLKNKYRVYYERLTDTWITVYRVWPSRSRELNPNEII
jgi:plasmid stabilization system protein ParE